MQGLQHSVLLPLVSAKDYLADLKIRRTNPRDLYETAREAFVDFYLLFSYL
jgi:hypothetical protein